MNQPLTPTLRDESIRIKSGKQIICPKCGWKCSGGEGLHISMGLDIDGDYCMKCWAKWISENITKMEEK